MTILFLIAVAVAAYFLYMRYLNKQDVITPIPPIVTTPEEDGEVLPPTLPTVPTDTGRPYEPRLPQD
jgi:hypothetical protein